MGSARQPRAFVTSFSELLSSCKKHLQAWEDYRRIMDTTVLAILSMSKPRWRLADLKQV